ncbi:MAG: Uma2 family endonuclease [Coleofasciculus sp. B1-GNL1-01]|uniref:Uma2 family endonuclease n=1 Tax=Coleofasciculus sp. B1-GNL1-01 TaxID=3068484 RepID=UPI0032F59216
MTTTSTTEQPQVRAEPIVTLRGVSWQTYQALMHDVGDNRAWRIAYDQGILEIRMPLPKHEEPKRLLESFIEVVVDELGIELRSLGALTLEREDLTRAVEPDTCFYIQNESRVRGQDKINLPDDPPPDLVVESDYKNSSINKFKLYAELGVPELWRYRQNRLEVYQLIEGQYEKTQQSPTFSFLPIAEIPGLIEQSKTMGQRAVVRLFRQRIREILANQSSD